MAGFGRSWPLLAGFSRSWPFLVGLAQGAPDMTVNGSGVRDGDGVETNQDIVVHVGSIWDSAGESHTLVSL